jgi:hypothetical protein
LNKKSIEVKEINKILNINNQDLNMNSHIENSVVAFASRILERFYISMEINTVFDYMSNFTKRESIIEVLVEANKLKEVVYLVN